VGVAQVTSAMMATAAFTSLTCGAELFRGQVRLTCSPEPQMKHSLLLRWHLRTDSFSCIVSEVYRRPTRAPGTSLVWATDEG
jgi:hypothetical protein